MSHTALKTGDDAPEFCMSISSGKNICLSELKGKWVVLYFYPKDNTPGCTTEALEFSALITELEKLNTVVFGVSKDSVGSHQKFVQQKSLKVELFSDPEKLVLQLYGAWQLKKMYGKESWGVVRSTVLIDPNGKIAKTWPKIAKAAGHAEKVLEEVKRITQKL